MNLKEIKEKAVLDGSFKKGLSNYSLDLYVPLFGKELKVLFYNVKDEDQDDWNLTHEIIQALLNLSEENQNWLKENIYKHFQMCIQEIEYGMVNYDYHEDYKICNQHYFKIHTPEDAFQRILPKLVLFELDYQVKYFLLEFSCPWETEHGIRVHFKEGRFISIE